MLNKKRKGFTIVELVIVIAVIAVLAAVLIPTFSSVVDRAHESAALQEVQSAYIEALAEALGKDLTQIDPVTKNGITFNFTDSAGQNADISGVDGYPDAKIVNGVVVLGPASDGETGGTGSPVTTAADLIAALKTGGTVTLGDSIVITAETEAISIPSEATINLNGHTLTLGTGEFGQGWTCSPITVSGTLTITGSENSAVEIATYDYNYAGIHVQSGGKLNLTNIAVNDTLAMMGIKNEGDANFTNVNFTADNGQGLINTGDVVISGGEFSSGEDAPDYLIHSTGGTMKIDGTTFSGTCSASAIQLNTTGTLNLKNVSMTTTSANVATTSDTPVEISGGSFAGTISGQFAISDGTFADVGFGGESSVSGGTFSGKLTFGYGSETTITDGTFTGGLECSGSNGVYAKVIINGGKFSNTLEFKDWSDVEITSGTFNSVLTLERTPNAGINIYIKYGTTFGETTLSAATGDSAVYTVPSGFSTNSVTKGTDGWTITEPQP